MCLTPSCLYAIILPVSFFEREGRGLFALCKNIYTKIYILKYSADSFYFTQDITVAEVRQPRSCTDAAVYHINNIPQSNYERKRKS